MKDNFEKIHFIRTADEAFDICFNHSSKAKASSISTGVHTNVTSSNRYQMDLL